MHFPHSLIEGKKIKKEGVNQMIQQHVRTNIWYLGVALLVLGGTLTATAKGNNAPCGYNVTANILPGPVNNPFQLLSDGKGTYDTETISRRDSVNSVIQLNSCDWLLDLSNSTSRTVQLTLTYPDSTISTNPPPPFTGTETVTAARIISICGKNTLNGGVTYGTMTFSGQTLDCALDVRFNYGGQTYSLSMDPAQYGFTTWVQAVCIGATGSGSTAKCDSWTVSPVSPGPTNNITGQNTSIGELFLFGKNGRETPIGLYEVAFSTTITNP